jgi:hypothetical protein
MSQRNTEKKDGDMDKGLGTWDMGHSRTRFIHSHAHAHAHTHAHPRTYNWGRRAEQLRERLGWRWYVCSAVDAVGAVGVYGGMSLYGAQCVN